MRTFILTVILWFSPLAFAQDLKGDGYIEKYVFYTGKIKDLYLSSLKLAKKAKDVNYKNQDVHQQIQGSLGTISKYCSGSFESQLYYNAQQQNRDTKSYQYDFSRVSKSLFKNRQEVYKKCKTMKALLSRASFRYEKKNENKFYNADVQNHESIFAGTQHVYKEVKDINKKLHDSELSFEVRRDLVKYYDNYKDYVCNFDEEKKIYLSAKVYLRSKIAEESRKAILHRERGVASGTKNLELETLLSELERRHISYDKMCDELQFEKDKINKSIDTIY